MLDRSRACGRYRISMLDRPDAVNIAVIRLKIMVDSANNQRLGFIAVGVAFLLGAFRGGYLLGWQAGLMLGVFLALAALAVWDAFSVNDMIRRFVAVCFFAFLLIFILAPNWLSEDIQYSIDRIANERKMRSELNNVFADDTRFSSLRPTFTHLKCTNIELSGTLPDSLSLDYARTAIGDNCPTVCEMALVSWNVRLRDSGEQIKTNDGRMSQWNSGGDDAG